MSVTAGTSKRKLGRSKYMLAARDGCIPFHLTPGYSRGPYGLQSNLLRHLKINGIILLPQTWAEKCAIPIATQCFWCAPLLVPKDPLPNYLSTKKNAGKICMRVARTRLICMEDSK